MGAISLFRRCFSSCVKKSTSGLNVILSEENDIYFNLALENSLLNSYGTPALKDSLNGTPLLFLWRNSPCVIVGRNQNVWSECDLENVKKNNVKIVRRFTGGGAVYQDLGNTCFTFISSVKDYNFAQNSKMICDAISKLIGQNCEPSGRNDLCVNGLKFSGAAFKVLPNAALHHGTLLININEGSLGKYLTPDKSKLEKHNVQSVQSRVTNLSTFKDGISHETVCDAIIKEVADYYDSNSYDIKRVDGSSEYCQESGFVDCYKKLVDEKWIYGDRVVEYTSLKHRFDFGSIEFCLDINKDNVVEKVWIFSDCLNAEFIDWLKTGLNKKPFEFTSAGFQDALGEQNYEGCDGMLRAIREWMVAELETKASNK